MLLPVSHEDGTVRRWPVVSLGIIGICFVMQVHACIAIPAVEAEHAELERKLFDLKREVVDELGQKRAQEAAAKRAKRGLVSKRRGIDDVGEHPSPLIGSFDEARGFGELDDAAYYLRAAQEFDAGTLLPPEDPRTARQQQLKDELAAVELKHPVIRFGYRPALDGFASLISAMFAHGGWLHLIGNMWFFYLCGCNLEDRWGRWQFTSFYLVAGVVASLTFTALHPEMEEPLVGASGAVAGTMGAFMICYARTKVKIFYLYMMFITPRYGTFNASAWLVMGFWIAEQLLWTYVEVSGGGSQVAFSAHVGGFAFGAVVAGMLRWLGVDGQLDEAVERAADARNEVFSEHPLYLEAMELRDRGQDAAAQLRLVALLSEQPEHLGAREALFAIGVARMDLDALDHSVGFLISDYGRRNADEALTALFRQLRAVMPEYGLTDQELLRVASAAKRFGDPEPTVMAVGELMEQHPDSPSLPRAMWAAAEVQQRFGSQRQHRDTLGRIARRFPEHACGGMARRELETLEAGA